MKTVISILPGVSLCISMFAVFLSLADCVYLLKRVKKAEAKRNELLVELETLKQERATLLGYLSQSTRVPCDICKHDVDGSGVMGCKRIREIGIPCFEWNGLCEENTAEGKEE